MSRRQLARDTCLVIIAGAGLGLLLWVGHVILATIGDAIS